MRTQGSADRLEERRRIAVRMFERNDDSATIAEIVDTHPQTVRKWRREFERGGMEALKAKPHPGPPCRLSDSKKQELIGLLAEPPTAYGYDTYLWTTRLLSRLIYEKFNVEYHHDHVGVIMKQLGYSYQRPTKRARERDEQRIAAWRLETWPTIVRASKKRRSTLVFVDEAGFSMIPSIKKQWALRGQTPVIHHRNRWHRKVSVIGGLAVLADRRTLGLYMNWHPESNIDQPKVVMFLDGLVREFPGPLDIIWDNLSCHGGKHIRTFLVDHPQVELHRLPPYAPELNPVETVWSLGKYHRMANHGIHDLTELHEKAKETINTIASQQHLLHACIRHADLHHALWPTRGQ